MIHPICISQFHYNTTLSLTHRYINLLLNESSLVWPTLPKQTTHKSQRPPQGVTACLEREIHYLPDDVYKQPLFHDVHQDPLKPREPHGRALRVSYGGGTVPGLTLTFRYAGGVCLLATTGVFRCTCHHMPPGNVAPTQQLWKSSCLLKCSRRTADERQRGRPKMIAAICYWMIQPPIRSSMPQMLSGFPESACSPGAIHNSRLSGPSCDEDSIGFFLFNLPAFVNSCWQAEMEL